MRCPRARRTRTLAQGTPTAYVQSGGVRRFCGSCGTPLSFARDDLPDELDVALSSFDNPRLWDVEMSIWTDHKARAPRASLACAAKCGARAVGFTLAESVVAARAGTHAARLRARC